MKTIANILLCLNEAEFIEAAIRSVLPGVDQMIVIDQGSTDGTQGILEQLREEFIQDLGGDFTWVSSNGHNFETRGEQFFRNLEIQLCFSDWLMVTDGDEIMSNGWEKVVRPFLDRCGDSHGAIRGNYFQMIGTSEYCCPDSPLGPGSGERPIFFRMNPKLRAGDTRAGTNVHCTFEGIEPQKIARLDFDIFHMGYCKTSLTDRFLRNINRGDWSLEEKHKAEFRKAAHSEPLNLLQQCVPLPIPRERLPASIRTPEFSVEYDSEAKRILKRIKHVYKTLV